MQDHQRSKFKYFMEAFLRAFKDQCYLRALRFMIFKIHINLNMKN